MGRVGGRRGAFEHADERAGIRQADAADPALAADVGAGCGADAVCAGAVVAGAVVEQDRSGHRKGQRGGAIEVDDDTRRAAARIARIDGGRAVDRDGIGIGGRAETESKSGGGENLSHDILPLQMDRDGPSHEGHGSKGGSYFRRKIRHTIRIYLPCLRRTDARGTQPRGRRLTPAPPSPSPPPDSSARSAPRCRRPAPPSRCRARHASAGRYNRAAGWSIGGCG